MNHYLAHAARWGSVNCLSAAGDFHIFLLKTVVNFLAFGGQLRALKALTYPVTERTFAHACLGGSLPVVQYVGSLLSEPRCIKALPLVAAGQAPAPPAMPQVAQDVENPSAKVRRQALRALRERGGPETLTLLARLLADPEPDIRESAVAGVIGVYVQPPGKRAMAVGHTKTI